jgi:hypothetical protein
MCYRIRDIAEIRLGVALRSRIEHDPAGQVRVVQSKDITKDGRLDAHGVYRVRAPKFKSSHRLRAGDVLLQPRGVRYPAAVVDADFERAITAAPLYVIRRWSEAIDPVYLVQFLNNPMTQARLRRRATGTYVPQLARAEIEDLEIPLPSLDDQRRLVELASLIRREREVAGRLAELRSQALWGLMQRAAEEKTQGRTNAPGL